MSPRGTVQGDGVQTMPHVGRRVVVVDADAAVRESLTFLLETAGYRVVTYASGPEALAAIDLATDFCLVVDQLMPEMTGLDMLDELHRRGVRLPTALMLEVPTSALSRRAAEQGIACVLPKLSVENDLLRFVSASAQ